MARFVDNVIAFRVLSMLVKNFEDTQAFKLGLIDKKGKALRKPKTSAEQDAYSYLHKLVFNMKKIINRLPGGESKLKSMVTALFLIKEYYESNTRTTSLMEDRYKRLMEMDLSLVEEEILVEKWKKEMEEDAPVNATGAAVSTDRPAIKSKDIKKYKSKYIDLKMYRR
jgi:hypothetical protein